MADAAENNIERSGISAKCDGCDFPEITYHCDECPMYLCTSCTENHRRSRFTKTHKLKQVPPTKSGPNEVTRERGNTSAEPLPTLCLEHPDEEINIFCSTCSDIVCKQCGKTSHSDHNIQDINKSNTNLQKLCLQNLTLVFEASSTIKDNYLTQKLNKDTRIKDLQSTEAELCQRKDGLHKQIDKLYLKNETLIKKEKLRVETDFEEYATAHNNCTDQCRELETKLLSVRNTDDVSLLMSVLKDFKDCYPQIKRLSSLKTSIQSQSKGLVDTKDSTDNVMSTITRFLAVAIPEHGLILKNPSAVGDLDFTLVCGDLTKETTDAIVHVTANPITFDGASGEALRVAGGVSFERACKLAKFNDKKYTVFTSPGNLLCKRVLHVDMTHPLWDNSAQLVRQTIDRCLEAANDEKVVTMSFPAVGTGKRGVDPKEVARCFKQAIDKFNKTSHKDRFLKHVRLVVYNQTLMDEFLTARSFSQQV